MISNYWPRLIWLALASFFLLHLLLASALAVVAPIAFRFAARLQPRKGARLLFTLRLLPSALSAAIVAVVCIPSYVWFEPETSAEKIGPLCMAAACLAILYLIGSAILALRSATQSFRHMRRWKRQASPEVLADTPALVIDSNLPFLALAGILRPTLIASHALLTTLSAAELDAAVRHEQAHRASCDNLKRLLMHCAPGLLPFVPGLTAFEPAWAKLTERAADDQSTAGNPGRALFLADALVRVARCVPLPQASPLVTPLLPEGSDLGQRVDRLLHPSPAGISSPSRLPLALAAVCFCLVALQPYTLRMAHEFLECLVR